MCKGRNHNLQAHLTRFTGITQERGLRQMSLPVNQFQRYNHQVLEGCDLRHQEHSNQVSQGPILHRHHLNSTTWPRSSAPTAAKILDGSRVPLVANSRDSPTVQRPASKMQTKTRTQLPAGSSLLLLSLQSIDRLLTAESRILRFPYRLLRALLESFQKQHQLDLIYTLALILFSPKESVSRKLGKLRADCRARIQVSMRMSEGRLNGRYLSVQGSIIIMRALDRRCRPGVMEEHCPSIRCRGEWLRWDEL